MTPILFVLLSLAGGLGATARLVVDGAIRTRVSGALPWGTIVINLTGSLALGMLAGLSLGQVVPESWHLVVGTGFLGGYTTFSTASFETVRLLQEREWRLGAVNGLGTLVCATGAAGLGLWVGALF